MLRKKCLPLFFAILILGVFVSFPTLAVAQDWQPIDPADLAMKDNPAAPGSHAMILFRSVMTRDTESYQDEYIRTKIFTEEGKKYGNIEIPFLAGRYTISGLKARTIRPDGSIVNFEGKTFDKLIVKTSGLRIFARTFAMPDVQVGSIIEYWYRMNWDPTQLVSSRWIVHQELFTRRATFAVFPYTQTYYLYWNTVRIPDSAAPKKQNDGSFRMTLENIPAFKEEPFAPPEDELKGRIDLFYTDWQVKSADEYWKRVGMVFFKSAEDFIGNRKGIRDVLATLVDPADPAETKLHKIYARVQQIRNLSYERRKSEAEEKREKLKDNKSVEDVLKNGYGSYREINRLLVALVRAAGMDAAVVRVSERNRYFFNRDVLDISQLSGEIAWVSVEGKEYYLDPGTAFCPFGLLSWENTSVKGIKLDKDGGTLVTTILPGSSSAVTKRTASLKLTEDGSLEGKLQVQFTGLEGLRRRLQGFKDDEATRRKEIEDEIKGWFPSNASVKIESIENWDGSEKPLLVTAAVRIPGMATSTGRRTLLPVGIFQTRSRNPFTGSDRLHPIYFRHPFQVVDDITLELPAGLDVETLPTPRNTQREFGVFVSRFERSGNTIRLQRQFTVETIMLTPQYYSVIRGFYDTARAADEEQVILRSAAAASR